MKLGKVTSNDPFIRLSVSIRQSTSDQIEEYRAYYKAVYGDDIDRSQLVGEVLRKFMTEDKEFVKHMENHKRGTKASTSADSNA